MVLFGWMKECTILQKKCSFLHSSDGDVFSELFDKIDELVIMMCDLNKNQVNITSK